ncbi:MAG: right-handed parallel beta-helix repeat-containing protein, partial [Phycisphaerae bacterium]|nr:right-handed parallel beta-helix repeat-containing protein [Phycisphaerae bacterium]
MATPKRTSLLTVFAVMSLIAGFTPAAAQTVIFVDASATGAGNGSSWADAYTSVQPALNAAQPGDQVWVAAGTYVENITLALGVGLYGGFVGDENPATFDLADRDFPVNETILDGNQGGSVVTAPSGATETTRIDGFTIRNGYGDYGGGISLTDSSPTIANNVITGNTSCGIETYPNYDERRACGGGINSSGGNPVIIGNLVMDNRTHAYVWESWSEDCVEWDPETDECIRWEWHANQQTEGGCGGGVYCSYGSPTIGNNTIMGNSAFDGCGGGIHASGSPTIANNTIVSNSAWTFGGGIDSGSGSPTIANNTITGNSGSHGGGIYSSSGSPTIANNTIVSNSALNSGGGIYTYSGSPTIANTIVAFNSSGIGKAGSGTPILHYNCVYGNTAYNYSGVTDPTGTDGNISADPKLADTAFGNMHIQSDSPCVGAGNNAYAFGDADMDGQPRIQPLGGTVDIGADESDGTTWAEGPYAVVRVAPDGDDGNDGSSWALAKRTVQAGVNAASALGGEVWVESGTYLERITLLPYAHVYGGFAGTETQLSERDWVANVTILDG